MSNVSYVAIEDADKQDLTEFVQFQFGSSRSKEIFGDLFEQAGESISRQFNLLPPLDKELYLKYYRYKYSQGNLRAVLGVSQSAVGRRLSAIKKKLRLILTMPYFNPIMVRREFQILLDKSLWETAYLYYWDYSQNIVSEKIEASNSATSYRLNRIINRLSYLSRSMPDNIQTRSHDPVLKVEMSEEDLRFMALPYLEYFVELRKHINSINYTFKKTVNGSALKDRVGYEKNCWEP